MKREGEYEMEQKKKFFLNIEGERNDSNYHSPVTEIDTIVNKSRKKRKKNKWNEIRVVIFFKLIFQ